MFFIHLFGQESLKKSYDHWKGSEGVVPSETRRIVVIGKKTTKQNQIRIK